VATVWYVKKDLRREAKEWGKEVYIGR
jgi:hypothetical protein